jgi:hypothetical protein
VTAAIVAFGWAVEPFTIGRFVAAEPGSPEPRPSEPAPTEPAPLDRG